MTKGLNQWLTDKIKKRNSNFQEHSRKRGTIFLYASLIVLVSIAVWEPDQIDLTFPFTVLIICSYIVLIIMPGCLNRWIWLIAALVIEACLYFGTLFWPPITISPLGYVYKIRLGIIVLLSGPIFYQIGKSWCYSTAMKCFVVNEITNISQEYSQACRAIKNQDKELIPESYQSIFSGMAFDHPNGNIQLTQINQHVVSILQMQFDNIRIINLIKAYWHNPQIEQLNREDTLQDETQTVSQVKKTSIVSKERSLILVVPQESEDVGMKKVNSNNNTLSAIRQGDSIIQRDNKVSSDKDQLEAAYTEYESPNNPIKSIEDFCKMRGLDKKVFRNYRKSKLNEKSSRFTQKKNKS